MLLKESELDDQDIIQPILGKPYKEPGKLLTATGSSMYFLKECTDLKGNPLPLKRDRMKAIFQRYEKGLLLLLNGSNYQNGIIIPFNSIIHISLDQNIHRKKSTPSLISKFISNLTITKELILTIETDFFKAKMTANFGSYNAEVQYFQNFGLEKKFVFKKVT
ncbi:MAG: hypothetical protein BalsKO_11720 [Balneolaceae bacterium]